MRKFAILLMFLMILQVSSVLALQEQNEQDKQLWDQLSEINFEEMQQELDRASAEYRDALGDISIENLTRTALDGTFTLNPITVLQRGFDYLSKEFRANIALMLQIIVLAILAGILNNLQTSLGSGGAGEVAFYSYYIIIASLGVKFFSITNDIAIG
ncbi:MAG: stage III sporulation protein AE, partial [Clostridiales bacterium]|nr:stage III sporulation protein AE [Clostridiales bacterium]